MNISFFTIPQYKNTISKKTTYVPFKGEKNLAQDTFTSKTRTQLPIKKELHNRIKPLSAQELKILREKLSKNKIFKNTSNSENHINSILKHVNTANIDNLNLLLNHPKIKSIPTEDCGYIVRILFNNISNDCNDLFEYVLNHPKCSWFEVDQIMHHLNEQNKEMVKPLLNNDKISNLEIDSILSNINKVNKDAFSPLLKNKKIKGYHIASIMSNINKENKDALSPLLKNKKIKGYHIASIMSNINKENKSEIEYLLNHDKVSDGKELSSILYNLTAENKSILKDILDHSSVQTGRTCASVLENTNENNRDIIIPLMNYDKTLSSDFICIQKTVNKYNKNALMQLISNNKNPRSIKEIAQHMQLLFNVKNLAYLTRNQDIEKIIEKVENQHRLMLKEPERYTSCDEDASMSDMLNEINQFWKNNSDKTYLVASLFDKETLNNFFSLRLYQTYEYFAILKNFNKEELERVYKMNLCTNIDGSPFTPTQKIEFIDLISAYQNNQLDTSLIDKMIQNGKLDLEKLNLNLLKQVIINLGLSKENINNISKEKFLTWNLKYIHLLAKDVEEFKKDSTNFRKELFSDLILAGFYDDDLKDIMMDPKFTYQEFNFKTQMEFNKLGINFEKWLYPSKEIETSFVIKDKNKEKLKHISSQIIEDINMLRDGREKYIDKQIRQFIKNGKFIIPQSALTSHTVLLEFTNNLIKQLKPIWELAEKNTSNQNKEIALKAKNTLTILSHLKQRLDEVSQIEENNSNKYNKNINWTIKMWDRIPQKDLFQGNYSTCCIGMGNGYGDTMAVYLLSAAFNMIEIIDNDTGKTIGNALCYFIKNKNNKISFVIDNVEINNIHKLSQKAGLQFREKLLEYTTKLTKDLTGRDDVPIILSANYNDIPDDDLPKYKQKNSFVGSFFSNDIYLDLYDGWVEQEDLNKSTTFLKLK